MLGCGTLLVLFVGYAWIAADGRQAVLGLIGAALGVTLYYSAFSFAGAWRRFLTHRETDGLKAQLIMVSVATALFFPLLGIGEVGGERIYGFVFPAGVSVLIGAFIFGVGMQLGGGCGSGTLYTAGGGNLRMVITLIFFILGSVLATAHLSWWHALPHLKPYSLVTQWGWFPALAIQGGVMAALWWLILRSSRRHTPVSWLLIGGAVFLALLNFCTLLVAGRPWGITSGFALWGAKLFDGIGVDVISWPAWSREVLDRPLIFDVTSVMNIGLLLGASLAALSVDSFHPRWRYPWRSILAACLGGLLLGYGARLAFGCNIGALFSGMASGSLHAWVWLGAAFIGNIVGVRLRPWFKLDTLISQKGTLP